MAIKKEVLDELLAGTDGKDVFGKDGLFDDLKKTLAERMLNAEMDHHLSQEVEDEGRNRGNHRNGYSKKRVLTDTAKLEIEVPRDREGTFEPALIAKYQRRFPGFDEKIISMYARGLTVRESEPSGRHRSEPDGERPPFGYLRHRGIARPDQHDHRCGAG